MNICVFGASQNDLDPRFIAAGEALGKAFAKHHHTLIFGGGKTGLMGAVARGVKAGGGKSIGVVPTFLEESGRLFGDCTELIKTDTMRERKGKMEELADAFVVMPGGVGTFDEFFETLTLKRLGRHQKPIAVLNTIGYYDTLEALLQNAAKNKFLPEADLNLYRMFGEEEALVEYLEEQFSEKRSV